MQKLSAQIDESILPAIVKNNGQLLNTNNEAAESIRYYSKAGTDLVFWNNNFDLIYSKYSIDTLVALPLSMHRVDLQFLDKNSNASYEIPLQDHYLNYYLDSTRGFFEEVGVFSSLQVTSLYSNINLSYTISESCNLLFTCMPGSLPNQI